MSESDRDGASMKKGEPFSLSAIWIGGQLGLIAGALTVALATGPTSMPNFLDVFGGLILGGMLFVNVPLLGLGWLLSARLQTRGAPVEVIYRGLVVLALASLVVIAVVTAVVTGWTLVSVFLVFGAGVVTLAPAFLLSPMFAGGDSLRRTFLVVVIVIEALSLAGFVFARVLQV